LLAVERHTLQTKNNNRHLIKEVGSWKGHSLGIVMLALFELATASASLAQNSTLTTIASFNGVNGEYPFGDLLLSGSTLFGTTRLGGAHYNGTVFSVPTRGGKITILATFNGRMGNIHREVWL